MASVFEGIGWDDPDRWQRDYLARLLSEDSNARPGSTGAGIESLGKSVAGVINMYSQQQQAQAKAATIGAAAKDAANASAEFQNAQQPGQPVLLASGPDPNMQTPEAAARAASAAEPGAGIAERRASGELSQEGLAKPGMIDPFASHQSMISFLAQRPDYDTIVQSGKLGDFLALAEHPNAPGGLSASNAGNYTEDSIKVFQAGGGRDFSKLVPRTEAKGPNVPVSAPDPKDYTAKSYDLYAQTGKRTDLVPVDKGPAKPDYSPYLEMPGTEPGTTVQVTVDKTTGQSYALDQNGKLAPWSPQGGFVESKAKAPESEVKTYEDTKAAFSSLKAGITEMRKDLAPWDQQGGVVFADLSDPKHAELRQQLSTRIADLWNTANKLYGNGVLNEGDLLMMQQLLPDPTSLTQGNAVSFKAPTPGGGISIPLPAFNQSLNTKTALDTAERIFDQRMAAAEGRAARQNVPGSVPTQQLPRQPGQQAQPSSHQLSIEQRFKKRQP